MSTITFSIFSNIFGFIVAAISLSAFLVNICRSHLPSNKIKELEYLMDETESFFRKAVEDGLLTEPTFVQQTENHLSMLRTITYRLQSRVYNATTLRQDYTEFLRGTSSSIGGTCQSLKKLKAQVITSSEEGRSRLMLMEVHSVRHTSSLPVPLHNPLPEHQHSPLPPVQIPRPSSCPPMLSGWNSHHTQRAFNPSRDPTQSDSDVRTADTQTCVSTPHTSVITEPGTSALLVPRSPPLAIMHAS